MSTLIPLSLLAAVGPALIYVYLVWWSDRYEREPTWLLTTTFLWGAIPAILLSVLGVVALRSPQAIFDTSLAGSLVQASLVSPAIEEITKGSALVIVFIFVREEIDDLLDGIVYGALVGIGFGMTENFLYFLRAAWGENQAGWLLVTGLRTVVFGLNHAFYSALLGGAIGYVALSRRRYARWLGPLVGLGAAISVHSLYNLSATLAAYHPVLLLLNVLLSWGGILIVVYIMRLALQKEKGWLRTYLADEVPGILSEESYRFAQNYAQRWGRWLALWEGKGRHRAQIEHGLHHAATELAFRKHRLDRLGVKAGPHVHHDIASLRLRLMRLDREFLSLSS